MESPCCRGLGRAIENPTIPLDYDGALFEYRLLLTTGGHAFISFCPFCGTEFPASRRALLHFEPAEGEIAQIESLVGINDIDELRKRLGEPVEVVATEQMEQFRFANWRTVELIVQRQADAKLRFIAVPKMRDGQTCEGDGKLDET
jgi:hypothetical protein